MMAAGSVFPFLLARYGVRGMFDLARPWRMLLLVGTVVATTYGGFRSSVLFLMMMFATLFVLEGLWRTRYMLMVLCLGLAAGLVLVPFADKMPLSCNDP